MRGHSRPSGTRYNSIDSQIPPLTLNTERSNTARDMEGSHPVRSAQPDRGGTKPPSPPFQATSKWFARMRSNLPTLSRLDLPLPELLLLGNECSIWRIPNANFQSRLALRPSCASTPLLSTPHRLTSGTPLLTRSLRPHELPADESHHIYATPTS